ncbi:LytR/AlgR family response regulator transcription factor [Streptococcus halotolerans]|uniref:LytR/AlgR family response regulator transcription factor n=1 Tax=Streptococcus halotolerans TaxID=1814128 RepID=UPI000787859E|nr:LytTR family transcriptional regulator DNA-binding domain-containing protein [Streptococcus halotolerans]
MKVVVIDDEPLARMELSYLLEQTNDVTDIWEGESIDDAFQLILTHQPDLLFLDIHLTDESGLDLAKRLSTVPQAPLIVFATAYDNHAVEAFEVNALDYILKPFEQDRIQRTIHKAKQVLSTEVEQSEKGAEKSSRRLTVETDERIYLIPFEDIIYCEVQGKETTVYTKTASHTSHTSLSAIEKLLTTDRFMKVHRSYLINQDQIKEIQPWFNQTYQITMTNGGKVPVSRSYLKAFKERLGL